MSIARVMLAAGAVVVAAAFVWWWTTFGDVIQFGYLTVREASQCLVRDSDICALARALCLGAHPRALAAYWASAFWIGVGLLSLSLLTAQGRADAKKRRCRDIVPFEEVTPP